MKKGSKESQDSSFFKKSETLRNEIKKLKLGDISYDNDKQQSIFGSNSQGSESSQFQNSIEYQNMINNFQNLSQSEINENQSDLETYDIEQIITMCKLQIELTQSYKNAYQQEKKQKAKYSDLFKYIDQLGKEKVKEILQQKIQDQQNKIKNEEEIKNNKFYEKSPFNTKRLSLVREQSEEQLEQDRHRALIDEFSEQFFLLFQKNQVLQDLQIGLQGEKFRDLTKAVEEQKYYFDKPEDFQMKFLGSSDADPPEGRGVIYSKEGKYEQVSFGSFKNGCKEGFCRTFDSNGKYQEGIYLKDKLNGLGIEILPDGVMKLGFWEKGIMKGNYAQVSENQVNLFYENQQKVKIFVFKQSLSNASEKSI